MKVHIRQVTGDYGDIYDLVDDDNGIEVQMSADLVAEIRKAVKDYEAAQLSLESAYAHAISDRRVRRDEEFARKWPLVIDALKKTKKGRSGAFTDADVQRIMASIQ